MGSPGDLFMMGLQHAINKSELPVHPCINLNVNCGEAGCLIGPNGDPVCMCIDGMNNLKEPDEHLKCNWTITSPIDAEGKLDELASMEEFVPPFRPPVGPLELNTTELKSVPIQADMEDRYSSNDIILYIIVPVVCAVVLVITVIVILLVRRRRHIYSRAPKLDSLVTFIHKQDSVSLLENMTVISKNPSYCTHELDHALLKELRQQHIPKDKLHIQDEIGEGAFGKVFKGEMQISEDKTKPVAVKILKSDASRETKDDFRREVKIMGSFDHANILKLLGIVPTRDESPYMIFEYMEHGDLTEVLRRNDPCLGSKHHIRLRQTDLLDIATQIANGMVYLASRHFVHRDLATRNCLVGADLVVKISDFGMSRDIYTCDYYKIGGSRMLPVRWMSPESMKYGKCTTESDVWAFGVVLWEIFSLGKQPHYGHGNEEVIRFIEDGILLQKPNGCPETLYHVMLGCWRRDPIERFRFERIHNLLLEYERTVTKYARHVSLQRVTETPAV